MSSDDPTLPSWVAPDMHGVRARMSRRNEAWRALVRVSALGLGLMLAVVFLIFLGVFLTLALVEGLSMGLPYLGVAAVLALIGALGASGVRRWDRDHVFAVTLHGFKYNDLDGQFWELPLSALTHAEADGDGIRVFRRNADSLFFPGGGVTRYERELFAWYLSRLIREQGEAVDGPPPELVALRGAGDTGRKRSIEPAG
ncbi:MAG: phage holin family protein [Alphaproteobacteria bacterium]|nr:phage holin family protein [Alphaproteobacteria bacterium]